MHYWTTLSPRFVQNGVLTALNGPGKGAPAAAASRKYTNTKRSCLHCVRLVSTYALPTVLNVLFIRALADRLAASTPLIPTAVDPGYCSSNLVQNGLREFSHLYAWCMEKALSRSAEKGARQLVWAALGPNGDLGSERVQDLKGGYVTNASLREPSDFVLSSEGKAVQDQAWVSRDTNDEVGRISFLACNRPKRRTFLRRSLHESARLLIGFTNHDCTLLTFARVIVSSCSYNEVATCSLVKVPSGVLSPDAFSLGAVSLLNVCPIAMTIVGFHKVPVRSFVFHGGSYLTQMSMAGP